MFFAYAALFSHKFLKKSRDPLENCVPFDIIFGRYMCITHSLSKGGAAMTLEQFYILIGSDYRQISQRLHSEALIRKFVIKYAADPTYQMLSDAIAASDWEVAFRAAHTLKGVALNLGFDRLNISVSALTEALRGPKALTDLSLWDTVQHDQQELMRALSQLDA